MGLIRPRGMRLRMIMPKVFLIANQIILLFSKCCLILPDDFQVKIPVEDSPVKGVILKSFLRPLPSLQCQF